jgi:hypothetical protein
MSSRRCHHPNEATDRLSIMRNPALFGEPESKSAKSSSASTAAQGSLSKRDKGRQSGRPGQ